MTREQLETGMRLLRENGVFRTIEARDATWGDEDLGEFLAQAGEGNSENTAKPRISTVQEMPMVALFLMSLSDRTDMKRMMMWGMPK